MNENFKEIGIEDKQLLYKYFNQLEEGISDYNFNLLFMWQYVYKTSYLINNDILYMIQDYKGNTYALMPICQKEKVIESFEFIYQYIKSLNKCFVLYSCEKRYVDIIKEEYGDKFLINADRDNFDYLYSGEDLRTLKGKKLHKKRNHFNGFVREYGNQYEYRALDKNCIEDCSNLMKIWQDTKKDDPYEQIQGEYLGIMTLLKYIDDLNIKVGGIYINNTLQAFTIGSMLNYPLNIAHIHVEKANPNIRGLYNAINKLFLQNEYPNVNYVNREEDMGIDGMRKAKMSYRPQKLIKKYTIKEKD